jgi:DNA-binding CsgD family transcriptional regulator/tetratricopeptide (TPR) repeat protein
MLEILDGTDDPARIAHHAINTGEPDIIVQFVPEAARDASRRESHREAARFYAAVHPHVEKLDRLERIQLLEEYHLALMSTDQQDASVEVADEILNLAKLIEEPLVLGRAYRIRARAVWLIGRTEESNQEIDRAVEILEPLGDSEQLALALRLSAHNQMLDRHHGPGMEFALRAAEMTKRLGMETEHAWSVQTLGTLETVTGDVEEGFRLIEESIALARKAGAPRVENSAYGMLGTGGGEVKVYDECLMWLDRGIALGRELDQDYEVAYNTAWKARIKCEQGQWDEAVTLAEEVTTYDPSVARISPVTALGALGRVRVRKGDPGAEQVLREALDLGVTGALQHIWAPLCALAEMYWLQNKPDRAIEVLREPLRRVLATDTVWGRGELAYWMWRVGGLGEVPDRLAAPFEMMITGDWEGGAAEWNRIGCPYEEAMALSEGDTAAKFQALEIFDSLGARPAGQWLRSKLRDEGIESIPRGPRQATRENPEGLTSRQAEVYELITKGLSNGQIASRLFISQKTVEHHVSAVFAKLGVTSRSEAIARALEPQ